MAGIQATLENIPADRPPRLSLMQLSEARLQGRYATDASAMGHCVKIGYRERDAWAPGRLLGAIRFSRPVAARSGIFLRSTYRRVSHTPDTREGDPAGRTLRQDARSWGSSAPPRCICFPRCARRPFWKATLPMEGRDSWKLVGEESTRIVGDIPIPWMRPRAPQSPSHPRVHYICNTRWTPGERCGCNVISYIGNTYIAYSGRCTSGG